MSEWIETFEINNRINLYLLNAIAPGSLKFQAGGKGRTVGEQFAHIHNVRLMWLNAAAPDLAVKVEKIEKEADKKVLEKSLKSSGEAIAELLKRAGGPGGKIKNFKPHSAAFVGYLVSHESHHRGQIALTLKLAGAPLDKKIGFGIWEWGSR